MPASNEGIRANSSLTAIHGIGARKQEEFGPVVLFTIQQWCEANRVETDVDLEAVVKPRTSERPTNEGRASSGLSESKASEYFDLFEQGLSMEDVAHQLDRSLDTVSKYLGMYIETHRLTEIGTWIMPAIQERVDEAIGQLGSERLKPLFEYLKGEVAYAHIRIVVIAWNLRQAEES